MTTDLHPFDLELIASIENEQRHFDMSSFHTGAGYGEGITCYTASCMAGHIVALRPKVAAEWDSPSYEAIAKYVYRAVTGKRCKLDFYGINSSAVSLKDLTRRDAVLHIKGEHPNWEQLSAAK